MRINTAWVTPDVKDLFFAILRVKNQEEAIRFFRDLLTEEEIREFAARWKVARMLNEKKPYTKIVNETGMSSTTIARISKWLNNGMNGYKLAIAKLNTHHHGSLSPLGEDS